MEAPVTYSLNTWRFGFSAASLRTRQQVGVEPWARYTLTNQRLASRSDSKHVEVRATSFRRGAMPPLATRAPAGLIGISPLRFSFG